MIKNKGVCNDESCKCDCHVKTRFRRGNKKDNIARKILVVNNLNKSYGNRIKLVRNKS